jgi:hypothetical protein
MCTNHEVTGNKVNTLNPKQLAIYAQKAMDAKTVDWENSEKDFNNLYFAVDNTFPVRVTRTDYFGKRTDYTAEQVPFAGY